MKMWKPLEDKKVKITIIPFKDWYNSPFLRFVSKEKLFECMKGECEICLLLRIHESNYPFSFGV